MRIRDLKRWRDNGLCEDAYDRALALFGDDDLPVRELAARWIADGGDWLNVVRVAAVVSADRAWIWEIARMAFVGLPGKLGDYARTLGPENWRDACSDATAHAYAAGAYAAYAAYAAAAYAAYAAAAEDAARAAEDARAARNRIIEIACVVIVRALGEEAAA